MYNNNMSMQKGRVKGFTIIETMLFLALTGLMLVGALVGIGNNLARQRYKDSVQDVVTLIRNQYDYVTRVQIAQREGKDMCEAISGSGSSFKEVDNNFGRGRSLCNIYGVAIIFGLDDDGNNAAGAVVQSTSVLGRDIVDYEESLRKDPTITVDPEEYILGMTDQQLLQSLHLNNIVERFNHVCEPVKMLDRKVLNWGAKIEDVEKDVPKKGIVLIIRSPRDGSVHTYTYDFSNKDYDVLDYGSLKSQSTTCSAFTAGNIDINTALGADPAVFNNTEDFKLCITSDDITGTYGKRRMIKIAADGHNSSAVSLIDEESEEDSCD